MGNAKIQADMGQDRTSAWTTETQREGARCLSTLVFNPFWVSYPFENSFKVMNFPHRITHVTADSLNFGYNLRRFRKCPEDPVRKPWYREMDKNVYPHVWASQRIFACTINLSPCDTSVMTWEWGHAQDWACQRGIALLQWPLCLPPPSTPSLSAIIPLSLPSSLCPLPTPCPCSEKLVWIEIWPNHLIWQPAFGMRANDSL